MEFHRKYFSQSCRSFFCLLVTCFFQFSQTESKAGKVKSWSSKPGLYIYISTIKYLSGLGCEPLTPLKVWYSAAFWRSWYDWPVWRCCCYSTRIRSWKILVHLYLLTVNDKISPLPETEWWCICHSIWKTHFMLCLTMYSIQWLGKDFRVENAGKLDSDSDLNWKSQEIPYSKLSGRWRFFFLRDP